MAYHLVGPVNGTGVTRDTRTIPKLSGTDSTFGTFDLMTGRSIPAKMNPDTLEEHA
ncbi:hypothetical protein GCM10023066_22470 [Nocardioides kongjuensis]